MDYMGKDSFDNIWAKICQTVEGKDLEVLPGSVPTSQNPANEEVAQTTESKPEKNSFPASTSNLEYIETLPSEPPVSSTEEDEIIFAKPEKGAPLLSNIKEEEEGKVGTLPVTTQDAGMTLPTKVVPPEGTLQAHTVEINTGAIEAVPAAIKTEKTSTEEGKELLKNDTKIVAKPVPPANEQETPSSEVKTEIKPTPDVKAPAAQTPTIEAPLPEIKTISTPPTENKTVTDSSKTTQGESKIEAQTTEVKKEEKPPQGNASENVLGGQAPEKTKDSENLKQAAETPKAPSTVPLKPEDASAVIASVPQNIEMKAPKANEEIGKIKSDDSPKAECVGALSTDSEKKTEGGDDTGTHTNLPQSAEAPKSNTVTEKGQEDSLPKAVSEKAKPLSPIKTEPVFVPQAVADSSDQGVPIDAKQALEKESTSAVTDRPQEQQIPATPTITPPTPTTPTSMALMVIPKDSKSLVKLSDIIDPTKPVQVEEQQTGPTADPIPMPPIPEPQSLEQKKTKSPSPSEPVDQSQKTSKSESLKDNGKQKKGVFSKILEIVGVSPKDKKEGETDSSSSVFYDLENAKEAIQTAETAEEVTEISKDETGKTILTETISAAPIQKQQEQSSDLRTKGTDVVKKPELEKTKTIQKPSRNQKSEKVEAEQGKSPKLPEPKAQEIPDAMVPPQSSTETPGSEQKGILEAPPVDPIAKEKVKNELEDIIEKAKSEVESRFQATDSEAAGRTEEPVNTMKLLVDDGKEPPLTKPSEVEEIKITSPEDRQKHKGEPTTSKLSDQILKAIPPPRRKAISDAKTETSSSTGAIPKTTSPEPTPAEEPKSKEKSHDANKGKTTKSSSIPVPPPRNKPKPPQPTPSKTKPKK